MKQVISAIGSMKIMALLMLIFAVTIGYATFIENDYGTETAKAVVYHAKWFEVLLLLLAVNLSLNIYNYKMLQKKKILIFTFHISFLIILIGAAVTRYVGYEGSMHIREGSTVNTIISVETYIKAVFDDNGKLSQHKTPVFLSKMSQNSFSADINVNGKTVYLELMEYIPDAVYGIKEDPTGNPIISMMITTGGSAERIQLSYGEYYETSNTVLNFGSDKTFIRPVVDLYVQNEQLMMKHPMALRYLNMDDQSSGELPASEGEAAASRMLFSTETTSFVVRDFYPKAIKTVMAKSTEGPQMLDNNGDALLLKVSSDDESETVAIFGRSGVIPEAKSVMVNGLNIQLSYGAERITLPFALKLEKFDLERYPGSNSPASYASDVILIDKEQGIHQPYRIFMNNVLDHRGFRFFQSSYDRDEKGTILSVNNDPGTWITYVGYLLLTIGMFGALFLKEGRFGRLMKKARKASEEKSKISMAHGIAFALMALMLSIPDLQAAEVNQVVKDVKAFDAAHAKKFGHLVTQDSSGRMKPMDTLSSEIMHKLYRSDTILGLNSNQVILGMMTRPDAWREIKVIRTTHKKVNELVGNAEKDKAASFSQFFDFPDDMTGYKLGTYVEEAIRKAPGKRDKFDKAVLKVDERVNVVYMVFTGSLLRLWPKPNDANNKWHGTMDALQNFTPLEAEPIRMIAVSYFTAVDEALQTGNWEVADNALKLINAYQRKEGAAVRPSESKIDTEIWYNHADIFERLWPLYFLVGLVLLILSFVKILKPSFKMQFAIKSTFVLLVLFLIVHTAGLGMRWYIAGHAPWSDGYESMLFIAWSTVLAGFIFSKHSPITMAATGILTGLILFVAHLNWMDPTVTNLVPVLQSYWLSIHVSMITASYGFLGLGALLGFLTLILFILKTTKNEKLIGLSIKELNAINEMSLMIGLAMLTVGNFLGGVWANESWGRYWGWDPKETWALVTILVYAVVVHLRFIKAIYSPFAYSVISLLSFTTVLMTYFGVNYYLAGMHSYAKGDPVPVPDFVPMTYAIIFIIIALAWRKRKIEA